MIMRRWLGVVAMLLLIGVPAYAEEVWTFEPTLPVEGSTEWEEKLNIKINHFDLESLLTFALVPGNLGDEEIDQYFKEQLAEAEAALASLEAQTVVQQVRINWQAHPDPDMRTFEMYATVGGIDGIYSMVPDFVAGVISHGGDLISISQPTMAEAGLWTSLETVLRDFIVALPEGPISKGHSWQKVTYRNAYGDDPSVPEKLRNLPFHHEYTLMDVEERNGLTLALIHYHATFEVAEILSPEESMTPEPVQMIAELILDGDFWVDVTTGLVVEAKQSTRTREYIALLPPISVPESDAFLEIDFDEPFVLQKSDVTVYSSISQMTQ